MLKLNSIMIGSSDPQKLAEFYAQVFEKPADWKDDGWSGWQFGDFCFTIGEHSEVKKTAKEPQRVIFNPETAQVGENLQLYITEPRETKTRSKDQADILRVYVNPKIVAASDEKTVIYEGCGSVASAMLFGPVERPRQITVEAFDEFGKKFRFTADGILGRVIQHEHDHLSGIEFTEKIADYTQLMHVDFYREKVLPDPEHVKACQITAKEFKAPIHS